jgi:tetratricopeptide (TPR) repeat protein
MIVIRRLLILVVAAELIVGGVVLGRGLFDPRPPLPDLSDMDSLTQADLRQVREQAIHGDQADWRTLAQAYVGQGFYAEAAQCYEIACNKDPGDQESVYGLAFSLERMGRLEEAIPRFLQAADLSDDELTLTCQYQIGRCRLRLEQLEEAERMFRQIPSFPPAGYMLAKLLIRTDRAAEAVPLLEQLMRSVPESHKLMQLRVQAAEALDAPATARRYRDLIARTEAGLRLDYAITFFMLYGGQHGLPAQLRRCGALENSPEQPLGLNCYLRGLKIAEQEGQRQYHDVSLKAAEIAMNLQRPDDALPLLEHVRSLESDDYSSVELRGDAHFLRGDPDQAVALWRQSLLLRPTARVHSKLAMWHEQQKETQAAREYGAAAEQLQGMAAFYANRLEEAEAYFEAAETLQPDVARNWYFRGEILRIGGQSDAALRAYERCLELDPEYQRARVAAAALSDNGE